MTEEAGRASWRQRPATFRRSMSQIELAQMRLLAHAAYPTPVRLIPPAFCVGPDLTSVRKNTAVMFRPVQTVSGTRRTMEEAGRTGRGTDNRRLDMSKFRTITTALACIAGPLAFVFAETAVRYHP